MKNTPTLREICRVLFRHKQKVVAFFCVTMALVVLGIVFYPRTYQSEAKLFIRIGRQSVALDPTATTGQTIAVNESRESEINSVLELLKSRSITEKVVDTIGASVILGNPTCMRFVKPSKRLWEGEAPAEPLKPMIANKTSAARREPCPPKLSKQN